MFKTLLFLLFSIQYEALCHNVAIQPNNSSTNVADSKDIKLVSLLKQTLRRNNDDYIDISYNKTRFSTNFTKQNATEMSSKIIFKDFSIELNNNTNKPIIKDMKNRRLIKMGDARVYPLIPLNNRQSIVVPSLNPNRFQKLTSQNYPKSLKSTSHPPKDGNGDKAERLKQFMIKNKGLLEEYISNKRAESQTEAMPQVGSSKAVLRDGENVQIARPYAKYLLPSPNQLDMAPAKGGRIHALRIKGRLCQRSVLMPEGPKYDSAGNMYLRAFSGPRDYAYTRPPALVLPRCCNCCRKSVLGCE